MNIQNISQVNFGAKISRQVYEQLQKQIKYAPKEAKPLLENQIKNVEQWGKPDSEVVICTNPVGNFCLGLRRKNPDNTTMTSFFCRLNGKTELSQFLKLKDWHFNITENTLDAAYRKMQNRLIRNALRTKNRTKF